MVCDWHSWDLLVGKIVRLVLYGQLPPVKLRLFHQFLMDCSKTAPGALYSVYKTVVYLPWSVFGCLGLPAEQGHGERLTSFLTKALLQPSGFVSAFLKSFSSLIAGSLSFAIFDILGWVIVVEDCPLHQRMLSDNSVLYRLDASSDSAPRHCQKSQTFVKCPLGIKTTHGRELLS